MKILKIENISEFLTEDKTQCSEIIHAKQCIENYIAGYFAPTINLKLEEFLNLTVDGKSDIIAFDSLSLLVPLAKLLDIKFQKVSSNDLRNFLAHSIQVKLNELKSLKTKEGFMAYFPTIYGIYNTREEQIKKSVAIECEAKRIIPTSEAEAMKYKTLRDLGINKTMHSRLLSEATTFNFESFIETYRAEIERIIANLDFLINTITRTVFPVDSLGSIDKEKIATYKARMTQKQRELK